MAIELITGTPGAGKTLRALESALRGAGVQDHSSIEAIIEGLKKPTRPLVVCGVEGLVPGLFHEIESPVTWQDLEDGSLILVDEVWKWWGKHLGHIKTDSRYLELAEHRHRGFDFIMTCQSPGQLQDHMKALVSPHLHVTRKFGTDTTVVYEWPTIQDSPNSLTIKKQAIDKVWKHPRPIFDLYESATVHTIKRKLPFKLVVIPALLLVVVGAAVFGVKALMGIGDDVKAQAPAAAGEDAGGAASGKTEPVLTADEWVARQRPRYAALPHSAPIFDDRPVTAEPRLICVVSGAGETATGHARGNRCRCFTEQMTRMLLEDAQCREIARWGEPYNPYRAVSGAGGRTGRDEDREASGTSPEPQAARAAVGIGEAGSEGQQAAYGGFRPAPADDEKASTR